MNAHRPEFKVDRNDDGRLYVTCLCCMDTSPPTWHRPNIEAWQKAHRAEALG